MGYLFSRMLMLEQVRKKRLNKVFDLFGIDVFCGEMGSGKSLSMVKWVYYLMRKYDDCILVTNMKVNFPNVAGHRIFVYRDFSDFYLHFNWDKGCIYMLDEMQIETGNIDKLSSADSKLLNTFFTQLRSRHVYVVCSTPNFSRLAKLVRENFRNLVVCSNIRLKQINRIYSREVQSDEFVIDGKIDMQIYNEYSFYHSKALYALYDTHECQGGV